MLIVQKILNFGSHFTLLLTLSAKVEKLTSQPVKCAMQCYFHLQYCIVSPRILMTSNIQTPSLQMSFSK